MTKTTKNNIKMYAGLIIFLIGLLGIIFTGAYVASGYVVKSMCKSEVKINPDAKNLESCKKYYK